LVFVGDPSTWFCIQLVQSWPWYGRCMGQNRHQKVFNRGLYVCSEGLDILKFEKNSTDL